MTARFVQKIVYVALVGACALKTPPLYAAMYMHKLTSGILNLRIKKCVAQSYA